MLKIDNKWFIVDCWHHRIIWSYDEKAPINKWRTLDNSIAGPHSIAFDGTTYAAEDTGRGAINFYTFTNDKFILHQRIENIGKRPHRIRFDEKSKSYYVLNSFSQEMVKITLSKNKKYEVAFTKSLKFLKNSYTRSFTFDGNYILFASNRAVYRTTHDDTFKLLNEYDVPNDFKGLNDIYHNGERYYLTATPSAFGIVEKLDELNYMKNIYTQLNLIGTPYYLSKYDDNTIILPEITLYSKISLFSTKNNLAKNVLYDFGSPTSEDIKKI